jgi:hypothetical protein
MSQYFALGMTFFTSRNGKNEMKQRAKQMRHMELKFRRTTKGTSIASTTTCYKIWAEHILHPEHAVAM